MICIGLRLVLWLLILYGNRIYVKCADYITSNGSKALQNTVHAQRTPNQIQEILIKLHKFHEFEFVTVFSKRLSDDVEIALSLRLPVMVFDGYYEENFDEIINKKSLGLIYFTEFDDPILTSAFVTLRGKLPKFTVFISDSDSVSKHLKSFFEKCWLRKFLEILLLVPIVNSNGDIYYQAVGYSPFPQLAIQDLNAYVLQENLTRSHFDEHGAIRNVYGYKFTTPVIIISPLLLLSRKELEDGTASVELTGTAGYFYTHFIAQIGGEVEPQLGLWAPTQYIDTTQMAVAENRLHLTICPISYLWKPEKPISLSYPIGTISFCVIVPVITRISFSQYLSRTFTPAVWYLVAVTFVCLLIKELISGFLLRVSESYDIVFLNTCRTLFCQPANSPPDQNYFPIYRFIKVTLLLLCSLVLSSYNGSLTALLSVSLEGKQIDNVEDLLKTNIEILVTTEEAQSIFVRGVLPKVLLSRIRIGNEQYVSEHRRSQDATCAHLYTTATWSIIEIQQSNVRKPSLRKPKGNLCSPHYLQHLMLELDSPFQESLTLFVMRVFEAGLLEKWNKMSVDEAVALSRITSSKEAIDHFWRPLNLKHFIYIFILVACLWLVAILCFIYEILHSFNFCPGDSHRDYN